MKITVLLGGTSAERDVSIASGLRIAAALRGKGHAVTLVDPATGALDAADEKALGGVKAEPPSLEQLASLSRGGVSPRLGELPAIREADVVFLALHGGTGEDGTVQAILDLSGAVYTGSGHLASALAMDKDLSKRLFRSCGVTTADWLMAPRPRTETHDAEHRDFRRRAEQELGLPLVVKPSKQGSTVGLSIVKESRDLARAITEAFRYDDEVMVERFVPGRELTVGILGEEALPVIEIKPVKEIYDYECKYTKGMAEEFPAVLTPAQEREIHRQARLAFGALKLGGYARIDFRMTEAGEFFCLEANTLPGMTETSLIPQAAAERGMEFAELCERIVHLALEARRG
jgi:D-alanine-D-alanine ligase